MQSPPSTAPDTPPKDHETAFADSRLSYSSVKKTRVCCCFRTKRGCCFTITSIIVLILIALGITSFFVYPRIPGVKLGDPYVPAGQSIGNSLQITGSPTSASASNPFQLTFNLQMDISVNSQNYIDYQVNSVKMDSVIVDSNNAGLPGTSATGVTNNIVIGKFSTTNFSLPLKVVYVATSPTSIATDPVIQSLVSSCGFTGGQPKNIKLKVCSFSNFQYHVAISIALISWTGYVPAFDGFTSFACPVGQDAWNQLLNNGGASVLGLSVGTETQ